MPPPQPHLLRPKYRPDIDGLRAIAVLSVVAFHAYPGEMRGGFIGVDIFFVISGYLISTIIFQNLDKGIFSFAEFYSRRVKRIFPALILVLAASYCVGWFVLLPGEFRQLGRHIAAGAVFASNFQLWSEAGYFDDAASAKPLLHLWSLGIEEQFYIVWPSLLWLARRRAFRIVLIAILAGVSFSLNVSQIKTDAVATFYFPQTRFWELLCGSLLAWWTLCRQGAFAPFRIAMGAGIFASVQGKLPEHHGKVTENILSFAGLLLLIYGLSRINVGVGFPGLWAAVPVLGAVTIIAAGPAAWFNRHVLSHPVAVWFGLISYPLYLWHWPLLSFTRMVVPEMPGAILRAGPVVASVALAWLTYRFVEAPVRLSGHGGKAIAVALVVLLSLVGCMGYATYLEDGFEFRQHASLENIDGETGHHQYYKYIAERYHICTPAALADEAPRWEGFTLCMQSKAAPDVDVALIGDSHAEQLFPGIAEALPSRNVAYYIKHAAPILKNLEFEKIFKHVAANDNIKYVVLAMYWEFHLREMPAGSSPDKEILKVIDAFTGAGKTVYVIDDIPSFPFDANACKRYRWFGWKNMSCEVGAEYEMRRYGNYIAALSKMVEGRSDVKMLATRRYFCDGAVCSMIKDGALLYRDDNHVNVKGSLFVGRRIVEDNPGIFGR
jgi:peptidoglycan/LPS O-acetylase OafA/YrhL